MVSDNLVLRALVGETRHDTVEVRVRVVGIVPLRASPVSEEVFVVPGFPGLRRVKRWDMPPPPALNRVHSMEVSPVPVRELPAQAARVESQLLCVRPELSHCDSNGVPVSQGTLVAIGVERSAVTQIRLGLGPVLSVMFRHPKALLDVGTSELVVHKRQVVKSRQTAIDTAKGLVAVQFLVQLLYTTMAQERHAVGDILIVPHQRRAVADMNPYVSCCCTVRFVAHRAGVHKVRDLVTRARHGLLYFTDEVISEPLRKGNR